MLECSCEIEIQVHHIYGPELEFIKKLVDV